jgi:hypothetical protein
MNVQRLAAFFLALALALPALSADQACPRTPLHTFIERGQDLYLGELHGTVEAPALMRCLVVAALERKGEPLIVSLEQAPDARDLQGDAWRGQDGRGSAAMWELTKFLLEQEKLGRLTLHQHVPTEFDNPFDPAAYERRMGSPLRELAGRGLLIVLSGNGMYAGAGLLHVDLESASGGTSWSCMGGGCGVHALTGNTPFNRAANTLMDGKGFGHDFVYLLPQFTASPPKLAVAN